jgi:hypothetical protein
MISEPAPVIVENADPINVTMSNHDSAAQETAKIVAAKAQAEAAILTTEGQRGINRLWERTQAVLAITVVLVTMVVVALLITVPVVRDAKSPDPAALVLLGTLATGVVTSYFQRTNHTKVGGVGSGSSGRGE